MAYAISPVSYVLGAITLFVSILAMWMGFQHSRKLGGIVGKSFFYGFLGTVFFLIYGLGTMVLNFFEPFRSELVGRRGWILMPLAILVGTFWFLSFRELGKLSEQLGEGNKPKGNASRK